MLRWPWQISKMLINMMDDGIGGAGYSSSRMPVLE